MRKIQILCIALGLFINLSACNCNDEDENPQTPGNELPEKLDNMTLSISFGQTELKAEIYDNPTTRDFLSRLPMTIHMGDIGNKEKYAGFSGGLKQEQEVITNNEPGQLVYWPTGPGIAIYYKTDGQPVRGGIIVMAKILSGTEILETSGSGEITFKLIDNTKSQ